jgi:hypothetical protein
MIIDVSSRGAHTLFTISVPRITICWITITS